MPNQCSSPSHTETELVVPEEDARLTPAEVLAKVRRLGLATPSEAAALIRTNRDGR